jgi:hypothetical protein
MPSPAPASFVATRTASPTGSGPRGGVFTGGRGRAVPAAGGFRAVAPDGLCARIPDAFFACAPDPPRACAPDAFRAPAPDPFARAPVLRAPVARPSFAAAARGLLGPPEPDALPPPPAPPARFSLLRPGRERGRLPMTPGSSLTAREYCEGLTILCASCCEIRCFARERRDSGVYSWPSASRVKTLPPLVPRGHHHTLITKSTALTLARHGPMGPCVRTRAPQNGRACQ